MRAKPTIRQQANAVELAAVNLRGHIKNLTDLVAKNQRPQWELDHCRRQYPALDAAAKTLAAMIEADTTEKTDTTPAAPSSERPPWE